MKQINNLKPKEYREGYELTLANAKRHREAVTVLHKNGLHTIAFNEVVLAGEELGKAVVLYLQSKGIKHSQIDKIFKRHGSKLEILEKFFTLDFSSEQFEEVIKDTAPFSFENLTQEQKVLGVLIVAGLFFYLFEQANKQTTKEPSEELKMDNDQLSWEFEKLRLKAVYVDFDTEEQKWSVPDEAISEELLKITIDLVDYCFDRAENMLDIPHEKLKEITTELF